jgi:hypothetical protein
VTSDERWMLARSCRFTCPAFGAVQIVVLHLYSEVDRGREGRMTPVAQELGVDLGYCLSSDP